MQTSLLSYQLINQNIQKDINGFQKIIDYLMTFVGEVAIKKESEKLAYISYTDTNIFAILSVEKNDIFLKCDSSDSVSVNLVRNAVKNIGYRLFNPQTKSYLANDPNIIEISIANIDQNMSKVFARYQLTPLFKYNGSLVIFASDNKSQIHLVNRHLLEYLLENPENKIDKKEFSGVVTKNIGVFIALLDRGVIPLSFHKFITSEEKVINLNGLNIDKLYRDISVNIIYFSYDEKNQSFLQTEFANLDNQIDVKKGQSLIKKLAIKNCHCIKIAQDIGYSKNLKPILSVSVFL